MKIGVVTLRSDNYGNKYQNYAVEQLLSKYGIVDTFPLCNLDKPISKINNKTLINKIKISYIRDYIKARFIKKYDFNDFSKPLLLTILYIQLNKNKLDSLKEERHNAFCEFEEKYLNISQFQITLENMNDDFLNDYEVFFCGSDQIWNPTYSTTTEMAFLSFAKDRSIALAPSFGLSFIPDDIKSKYKEWLNFIKVLSVREKEGQKIIMDITGRESVLLLDPTMAIDVEKWKYISKKPKTLLPKNYILCYFLGEIDKAYYKSIEIFAKKKGLELVMLFDIQKTEYYTFGPDEVLYAIDHADYVLTDSFHGTVFSILFKKNFYVFDRKEGNLSMSSRIETLLNKFDLNDRFDLSLHQDITSEKWALIDEILNFEKNKIYEYIDQSISKVKQKKL